MIGYGDESSHFVVELTYNYGVKSYDLGNDFHGITIQSKETVERIKTENYPFTLNGDGKYVLNSPDGYQFFVLDEATKGQGNSIEKSSRTQFSYRIDKCFNRSGERSCAQYDRY